VTATRASRLRPPAGIGTSAAVGVADHAGWAVLVTVRAGALVDRRRVVLLEPGLPRLPHHHDAQGLPLDEAVRLVERVRESAERCALERLSELAGGLPGPIAAIAIRTCPPLPATIAARLADYRARNVADTVLMRAALAGAATGLGWSVWWYEPRTVHGEAARVLGGGRLDAHLERAGRTAGTPWQRDHRMAMAAAIAAAAHVGLAGRAGQRR
jgi:hypothetical protein